MIDQPLGYATAGTSKANERPPEGKIAPELKRLQVQIPSPDQSFQTRCNFKILLGHLTGGSN